MECFGGLLSSRLLARTLSFLSGCIGLLLLGVPLSWCIPPSVVFNGVATVLDTGSTGLNQPKGVVVDRAGNIYIADSAHNQIVKVVRGGSATALVISGLSTGLSAPEGVAMDGSGNLYIADTGNNRVVMVDATGAGGVVSLGGLTLSTPRGIAVDAAGNVFISDADNNRIVKIASGGSAAVWTISGLGTALAAPAGLAVDAAGNLYIADAGNNRIVEVSGGGAGSVVSISGLGSALNIPTGVAVDGFANVFIADSGNSRVVEVTAAGAGSVLSTGSLTLNGAVTLAVDAAGIVYVADTANSRIVSLMMSAVDFGGLPVGASSGTSIQLAFGINAATTLGSVQTLMLGASNLDFTVGGGTTCTNGVTNTTCDVEVTFLPMRSGLRRGGVAIFDQSNALLAVVPIYGTGIAPLAVLTPGTASAISTGGVALGSPFSSAMDGAGNIYVGNYTGSNVVKIAAGGGSASVVNTGALTLNEAAGVAVDGVGTLYIADYGHNRIVVVRSTGTASVLTVTGLGTAINQPAALALDAAGNLYVADWGNNRIVKVTPGGVGYVVGTGSYSLTNSGVTGVAVDAQGTIYIADRAANRIVKVAASGAASLVSVGSLTLTNPQGVAVDGNGNLYIADSGHRRIVQVTTAGTASVVQTPGQTLGTILYGVAVDANGNVYAADWSNNRISVVNVANAALSFANTLVGATSSDSPKTAAVTNLGNEALTFSADPIYTADFTKNASDANLCASGISLDPGAFCDVAVLFTPQTAGSRSANVVVTDNHLNGTAVTQNVAVSGMAVSPVTPSIVWAQPSAISYGTTLSGILNAAAKDGSTSVDGAFAYTASLAGGTATSVTAATVLPAGDYTLAITFTPSSPSYTSATGGVSLTVNKATPSVALQSASNPALLSSSVSLSATVSSAAGAPSGSVNFYDGTTLLGSGTVASGAASYATSSLTAGTHSMTATYAGDSNFSSVTSSAVSQVVSDLTVGVASGGSSTATVSAGGTATYHLTIGPSVGTTFPADVSLSANGAPTGSTVTITPLTIAAGAGATEVAVSVQVPGSTAAAGRRSGGWVLAFAFPLIGMFVIPRGRMRKRTAQRIVLAGFLLIVALSIGGMVGCGNDGRKMPINPVQPTNYTITLTATSGGVSHSTALTLTVQ